MGLSPRPHVIDLQVRGKSLFRNWGINCTNKIFHHVGREWPVCILLGYFMNDFQNHLIDRLYFHSFTHSLYIFIFPVQDITGLGENDRGVSYTFVGYFKNYFKNWLINQLIDIYIPQSLTLFYLSFPCPGHHRLGGEWPGRVLHLWRGRGQAVPQEEWPQPHSQSTPGTKKPLSHLYFIGHAFIY